LKTYLHLPLNVHLDVRLDAPTMSIRLLLSLTPNVRANLDVVDSGIENLPKLTLNVRRS
jgi:hypothetical protein